MGSNYSKQGACFDSAFKKEGAIKCWFYLILDFIHRNQLLSCVCQLERGREKSQKKYTSQVFIPLLATETTDGR